ncbi:hypothetical protein QVD17_04203 [Tagetes erecta]|uniref:Uncharacterized protein n=1 Tax=Tagetes erecta TaxID=13708 RepID=A0AAD8PA97_TARER|nr:hypothetical protein QVD17_04203 [Tagetes erecta]
MLKILLIWHLLFCMMQFFLLKNRAGGIKNLFLRLKMHTDTDMFMAKCDCIKCQYMIPSKILQHGSLT